MKDLKIGRQLCIGIGVILAMGVILAALAWVQTDALWLQTKELYDHPLQVTQAVGELKADFLVMHRSIRGLLLAMNEKEISAFLFRIKTHKADASRQINVLYDRYLGPRGDIATLDDELVKWDAICEETLRLLRARKAFEAEARSNLDGLENALAEALIGHVKKVDNFARNKSSQLFYVATEHKNTLNRQLGVMVAVILLLSLITSWLLLKRIRVPLKDLTSLAQQFRRGKMDVRSSYSSANEFGTLAASFNAMAETIQKEIQSKESAARIADEASEFAESIINTVREPLIALDQDLRVVKVSRSFYEFFRVKPEETLGQLIYDLGNKQWDIPKLRELLETILPQKADFGNYEVEHDFTTIGKRIMLLNARQIKRILGKEQVILLSIEDITTRRGRENSLKKAHEELEAFAYSVSHDLRAPLRGIDGWSLALLEDYKDKLDEKGRQYIDLVRSETQIMGRLIDDLLMFSRQSRAEMDQQPLDMTAMAQAIISRLQQQNPTLQADFIVQPGLKALGDAGLIEIALKNLLDNAAKFSSKNAHGRIEFGQVEKEDGKAFFVRDNGVGFDMAYSHKLFGVFRRLHKSSEFPGTGIGLASVQRIINRHGGRIWAEAKVNQGATFYFTLKEAT